MSKTKETKTVSKTDAEVERFRQLAERDAAVETAKAEFLQKMADLGLTTESVVNLVLQWHFALNRQYSAYNKT